MAIIKRAIAEIDDTGQIASNRPLQSLPSWLAKTFDGRQQQLKRFRRAKAELLEQIRENRTRPKSLQREEKRIVVSPSDPDAAIGKDKHKMVRPLYNVQYMCDFHSDVVWSTLRRLENQGLLDEQARKMDSEAGRASTRRRSIQVERRYGDSKKHRGGRDFHGRGLSRVTAETGLMVVAQNSLTLYNLTKSKLDDST